MVLNKFSVLIILFTGHFTKSGIKIRHGMSFAKININLKNTNFLVVPLSNFILHFSCCSSCLLVWFAIFSLIDTKLYAYYAQWDRVQSAWANITKFCVHVSFNETKCRAQELQLLLLSIFCTYMSILANLFSLFVSDLSTTGKLYSH